MILAIDAGNTRIKWGIHDGAWLEQGAVTYAGLPELIGRVQAYPALREAIVASVASPQIDAALQAIFNQDGIAAVWAKAQARACGVSNGYAHPAQLGSDRWAALVAAWHLKRAACVVVSAGTALTVDALSASGEFLGGLIVPGFAMMQQALVANTAGIASVDGGFRDFPVTTGDAVHTGALQAMAGAVAKMRMILEQREQASPHLLLAGGDAPRLQAALSGDGEIVDNLVLEGLVLIAGESTQ